MDDFLAFIVVLIIAFWLYRRYRRKKLQKENDKKTIQYESFEPRKPRHTNTKPEYMKYTKAKKLNSDYVVLDFETTGLDVSYSNIIQIGAVKYKDHEIIAEYVTNVNPQKPIPNKISKMTGIKDEDLKEAPLIDEAMIDLLKFLGNESIVAHNAPYDMRFLLYTMNHLEIPYKRFRVFDTLKLARKHIPTENHKLVTLKTFLNLDHYKSHNALHDCYAAGELYKYCFEKEMEDSLVVQ